MLVYPVLLGEIEPSVISLDLLHVSTLYSMQKEPLVFVIRNVLVGVRLIIDS